MFTLCHMGSLALAQAAIGQSTVSSNTSVFRSKSFSPIEVPEEIVGAWQVQIEGRAFKLKANYNIEIKINGSRGGLPEALVAYFAGDSRRPSFLCRSQLNLVSTEKDRLVFEETLNYKSERRASCPIWDQVAIEPRNGHLWLQWRDVGRRKAKIRMEAGAYRSTGGMECREVGGNGGSRGQVWCRDAEGNWAPKRL